MTNEFPGDARIGNAPKPEVVIGDHLLDSQLRSIPNVQGPIGTRQDSSITDLNPDGK